MKLHRVPILNDSPECRGGFIQSKMSNDVAFLDADGKMYHLAKPVGAAVLCLFDELKGREDTITLTKFICYAERVKKIFAG